MQLRLLAALAALIVTPIAACDDGGTATPGTTTPGSEESAFDDYFSLGGGERAANDSTTGAAQECGDDNCTEEPNGPDTPVYTPPVCESPLAAPAGALGACQSFCAKVTGCAGEPVAAAACASDCAASLAGMELAGVQQIFGCITAASCEDIADWNGGVGGETRSGGSGGTDVPPTDPMDPDDGASAGADDGGSQSDPAPPREDDPPEGEVVVTSNPIGECMDGVLEGWLGAPLSAGKQAVCDALPANEERCSGGDTTSVSTGSGEASANNTPEGNASDSADASGPSDENAEQAPAREDDPMPTDDEDDYSDAQEQCQALGSLLSAQTMTRIGVCDAMEDCDARDACLEQVLVCAPFIEVLYFGGGSEVSVDVVEPNETNPDQGSGGDGNTEPEPAPR